MNFNTTSFMAGVGSVVVVLSTGFAGGYFLANPAQHVNPPNRLQRLAAEDHSAPALITTKPEVVAAATPAAAPTSIAPAPAVAAPTVTATALAPAAPATPAQPAAAPQQTAGAAPAAPVEAKPPEPARTANSQETTAPVVDKVSTQKSGADADKERTSEARFGERKRSDPRRVAEQQRKQRELEVATVAVRRIIRDRDDVPDVIVRGRGPMNVVDNDPEEAPASPMPRFNLFGQ